MCPPRQTSRSLAAAALLSLASLVASGCSSTEADFGQAADGASELGDGDGDPSDPNDDGGDGDGDTGEEATDPANTEVGFEDSGLALELCDPIAEQVIAYDLAEANAEAAPVLVRESVLFGNGAVPAIPLSPRPFLNHYDFDYPAALSWEPQLSGELWQSQTINLDAPERYHLQYAVQGPRMDAALRLPVDLAVVIDLGAAMAGEPLLLAEEALLALESALIPGDRVTLISAGEAPTLHGTTTIDSFGLTPLSGLLELQDPVTQADVAAALALAYDTISPSWEGQGQQRVLLISNGHFEAQQVAGQPLAGYIEDQALDGRYLSCVGVGDPMLFDDAVVRGLAHGGRGALLFARDPEQLWLDLQQGFTAHMIAAASDLELTLSLPPGLAVRLRDPDLGDAPEPRLATLAPNDTLVFHHELEACGEIAVNAVISVSLEWTDPLTNEAKQAVWERPVTELGEASLSGYKGAATVAYARVLRGFRDGVDPSENYGAMLDAISSISEALEALPEDGDLIEMSSIVAQLAG